MSKPSNFPVLTCLGFDNEEHYYEYKNAKIGDIIEEEKNNEFGNLIKETERLSIGENLANESRHEPLNMKELVDIFNQTNFGGTGSFTNETSRMEIENIFFTNPTEK